MLGDSRKGVGSLFQAILFGEIVANGFSTHQPAYHQSPPPSTCTHAQVDACPPDVLATTGKALGHMLKQVFPGGTPKPLKRLLPEHEGGPHPEGPPAAKLEDMGRALPGIIPVRLMTDDCLNYF